jgi:hypothetical protein
MKKNGKMKILIIFVFAFILIMSLLFISSYNFKEETKSISNYILDLPDFVKFYHPLEDLDETDGEYITVIIEFEEDAVVDFKVNSESVLSDRKINNHIQNIEEEQNLISNKINKKLGYKVKVNAKWNTVINGESITIKKEDFEKLKDIEGIKNFWEETQEHILLQDSVPLINADDVWDIQLSIENLTTTYLYLNDTDVDIIKDSDVDSLNPTTNTGLDMYLGISNSSGGSFRTYMCFNMSKLITPYKIIDAELNLSLFGNYGISNTWMNVSEVYSDWMNGTGDNNLNETQITWNNQPCGANFDNSTNCNLTSATGTYFDVIGVENNYFFNITSIINNNKDNSQACFVIKTEENLTNIGGILVHSRNSTTIAKRPSLNITYESGTEGSNLTGEGIVVAVVDTGVQYTHPIFGLDNCTTERFVAGDCERFIGGWDFYNNDSDPLDIGGHGTHVAGIVGGNESLKGVAPGVKFLVYQVCAPGGVCNGTHMISAIENATNSGADIITMSISAGTEFITPIENAINNGTGFTLSAGNSGPTSFSVSQGSMAEGIISVGITNKTDFIHYYSSRGPVYINKSYMAIKPDIVAPGYLINSSWAYSTYAEASGTSMSAPHIAGVYALIKQLHPNWTVQEIKSVILTTTINTDITEGETQGAGRVDALKAINATLTFNDSNLFFGVDTENNESIWYSYKSLNVTNRENITLNFTFTPNINISGLTINLSNETVELASQESFELIINFTVNNTEVITEDEIITGNILINSSDNKDYRMPISMYLFVTKLDGGCPTLGSQVTNYTMDSNLVCRYFDEDSESALLLNDYTYNLKVDCNGSTIWGSILSGYGIETYGNHNLTINNCTIKGFSMGIKDSLTTNITLNNSRISDSNAYGLRLQGSKDITIVNSFFSGSKDLLYNDWDGSTGISPYQLGNNITFINNTFTKLYTGIGLSVSNSQIINNTFYNCYNGIGLWGDNNTLENNRYFINSSIFPYQSTSVTIQYGDNNIIRGENTTDYDYAYFIWSANNNTIINAYYEPNEYPSRSFYSYGSFTYNNYVINSTIYNVTAIDYEEMGDINITFKNYLKLNITNVSTAIAYANVTIFENSSGSYLFDNLGETDVNGLTDWTDVVFFYLLADETQEDNHTADLIIQVEATGYDTTNFTIDVLNESRIESIDLNGYESTETPVVITPSGGGGGGSSCNALWICGEWSSCSNGLRSRICADINHCGSNEKPPLLYSCSETLPTERIKGCVEFNDLNEIIKRWKLNIYRLDVLNEGIYKWQRNIGCI